MEIRYRITQSLLHFARENRKNRNLKPNNTSQSQADVIKARRRFKT